MCGLSGTTTARGKHGYIRHLPELSCCASLQPDADTCKVGVQNGGSNVRTIMNGVEFGYGGTSHFCKWRFLVEYYGGAEVCKCAAEHDY